MDVGARLAAQDTGGFFIAVLRKKAALPPSALAGLPSPPDIFGQERMREGKARKRAAEAASGGREEGGAEGDKGGEGGSKGPAILLGEGEEEEVSPRPPPVSRVAPPNVVAESCNLHVRTSHHTSSRIPRPRCLR